MHPRARQPPAHEKLQLRRCWRADTSKQRCSTLALVHLCILGKPLLVMLRAKLRRWSGTPRPPRKKTRFFCASTTVAVRCGVNKRARHHHRRVAVSLSLCRRCVQCQMEGQQAGVEQGAAQTALRSSKLRVRAFHMRMPASTRRRMLAQQWPPRWRAHALSIAAGVGRQTLRHKVWCERGNAETLIAARRRCAGMQPR